MLVSVWFHLRNLAGRSCPQHCSHAADVEEPDASRGVRGSASLGYVAESLFYAGAVALECGQGQWSEGQGVVSGGEGDDVVQFRNTLLRQKCVHSKMDSRESETAVGAIFDQNGGMSIAKQMRLHPVWAPCLVKA